MTTFSKSRKMPAHLHQVWVRGNYVNRSDRVLEENGEMPA